MANKIAMLYGDITKATSPPIENQDRGHRQVNGKNIKALRNSSVSGGDQEQIGHHQTIE